MAFAGRFDATMDSVLKLSARDVLRRRYVSAAIDYLEIGTEMIRRRTTRLLHTFGAGTVSRIRRHLEHDDKHVRQRALRLSDSWGHSQIISRLTHGAAPAIPGAAASVPPS